MLGRSSTTYWPFGTLLLACLDAFHTEPVTARKHTCVLQSPATSSNHTQNEVAKSEGVIVNTSCGTAAPARGQVPVRVRDGLKLRS